jgi:hypothetical protein
MKRLMLLFVVTFLLQNRVCNAQEVKKIDLIIEVNNELIISDLSNIYIQVNHSPEKISVGYSPGHLIINSTEYSKIDTAKILTLFFNYNTFFKQKQNTTNFKIDLTQIMLKQRYLILSCYDFHDRKYQRWYKRSPNQTFAFDIIYPGSGILISNK